MLLLFFLLLLAINISNNIDCMDLPATGYSTGASTSSLVRAAQQNDISTVEKLLASSTCNPNETNENGQTALHCAVFNNNEKIIDDLLQHPGTDATIVNNQGQTALDLIDPLMTSDKRNTLKDKIWRRQLLNTYVKMFAGQLMLETPNIASLLQIQDTAAKKKLAKYANMALKAINQKLNEGLQPTMPSAGLYFIKKMFIFCINRPGNVLIPRRER